MPPNAVSSGGNLYFFRLHSLILFTHRALRRACLQTSICFTFRRSLWKHAGDAADGGAASCACSCCAVVAQVDISDISSAHSSSVIQCLVGGGAHLGWKSGGLCSGVPAVHLFSALLFYTCTDLNGRLVNKQTHFLQIHIRNNSALLKLNY